jgi:hypothetical protein
MFLVLYGDDGVGKTTFASKFPNPIFIDFDDGSSEIDVDRLTTVRTLPDFYLTLEELGQKKHPYKTLVVDTLDALEKDILHPKVAADEKKKHIEDIGWNKGYAFADKEWIKLIKMFKDLRAKKGMNIICLAHQTIKKINDPTQLVPYDQFCIDIYKSAGALFKAAADAVLFAREEIFVQANDQGTRGKVLGEGRRVLHTTSMPGHDGKNRYGLPATIDLSYEEFMKHVNGDEAHKAETLRAQIADNIEKIPDAKRKANAKKQLAEKVHYQELITMNEQVETVIGV